MCDLQQLINSDGYTWTGYVVSLVAIILYSNIIQQMTDSFRILVLRHYAIGLILIIL